MKLYVTGPGKDESNWYIIQIADKDEDNFVCECDESAMANELVKRWNAHEEMLSRIKELEAEIEMWKLDSNG